MTVEELISILQTMPQHSEVIVYGYELGYDKVTTVQTTEIQKVDRPERWEGEFKNWSEEEKKENAVLLFAERNSDK